MHSMQELKVGTVFILNVFLVFRKEREQKMLKSKAAQKEMEAEMKAYYEDLKAFRQLVSHLLTLMLLVANLANRK